MAKLSRQTITTRLDHGNKSIGADFQKRLEKYGLTYQDFLSLLLSQDGTCAICCEVFDLSQPGRFAIDHDHRGGLGNKYAVRGLLCRSCNWLIGHAYERADRLTRAIEYLERFELGKPPTWTET